MGSPVTPSQFCAIKLSPTASPCDQLTSLRTLLDLVCQEKTWMYNADGTLSDAFKNEGGGGTGTGSNSLSAPSNVAATSSRTTDVKVTWSSVSSANSYSVYRGGTSNPSDMAVVASAIDATEFVDDDVVAGTVYYYAVKAHNTLSNSGFSAVASGKMASGSGTTPYTYTNTVTPGEYVVAADGTMTAEIWGPGGTGGNNSHSGWIVAPNTLAFGGGGASGAYLKITGIPIHVGDKFILDPGAPGSASVLYKTTHGSAVNAFANPGGNGGIAKSYSVPGTAGASPSVSGANNLGVGSVDASSSIGNPGTAGTTSVAGVGGVGVSASGYSAGSGTDGINSNTTQAPAGAGGAIRLTFS